MATTSATPLPTILLVGASRGLGLAMAAEFVKRSWRVIGTVRGAGRTGLHDLADAHGEQISIAPLDVTAPDQIAALRGRLPEASLDMLFVNAGTVDGNPAETISEVPSDEFVRVMLTNVLGAIRAVEGFENLVRADGLIGVMSSGQGSITNNTKGGHEVYRGSKAALNQCMRSYAARHGEGRAMVLMAPGWIRTELGGPEAPFGVEEAIPQVVDTLLAQQGKPGLRYLDRFGSPVPW